MESIKSIQQEEPPQLRLKDRLTLIVAGLEETEEVLQLQELLTLCRSLLQAANLATDKLQQLMPPSTGVTEQYKRIHGHVTEVTQILSMESDKLELLQASHELADAILVACEKVEDTLLG